MRAKNATKLKTPRLQKAASVATDVPHSVNENTGKSSASRPNTAEPQAKVKASNMCRQLLTYICISFDDFIHMMIEMLLKYLYSIYI